MLILTRRVGELIYLLKNEEVIKVRVLGIKGHQVRIGFDAPRDINIYREEVYFRIQQEKNLTLG